MGEPSVFKVEYEAFSDRFTLPDVAYEAQITYAPYYGGGLKAPLPAHVHRGEYH